MKWKETVKGLKAYEPGKPIDAVKREFGLDEITKLASNENPLGCSPKVNAFLKETDFNFAIYPDGYSQNMRTAVAEHVGVAEREILFGNGSDEIISIISRSLLAPGVNTIMAKPTFSQYKLNAEIEGAEVREVPLNDNREHDLDAMLAQVDDNTAVVWICSPNNPTGGVTNRAAIENFLQKVPADVLVVLDEAYIEYVTDENYPDTLPLYKQYPNVLLMRTFSKAYGLAAFRVGYAIGQEALVRKLDPVRAPFNNTVLSQAVVPVALSDKDYIEKCRVVNEAGKKQYVAFCERHGLDYYPSNTNFILFEIKADSNEVFQELMSRGYIVRSGAALGVPGYLRVTIGTEEQNAGLLAQLEEILVNKGVLA